MSPRSRRRRDAAEDAARPKAHGSPHAHEGPRTHESPHASRHASRHDVALPALALASVGLAALLIPWLARRDASNWTWGIDLWRYLPPAFATGALAAGCVALAGGLIAAFRARHASGGSPAAEVGAHAHVSTGQRGARKSSRASLWFQLALGVGLAILLWTAREKLHFLGDTHLRLEGVRRVAEGRTLPPGLARGRGAPLDRLVQLVAPGQLARWTGWEPEAAGQAASCATGFLFALAAMAAARFLTRREAVRLLAMVFLLAQGYLQVFAGYQEMYGLQLALLLAWCAAVMAEEGSPTAPLWSHVFLGLALLAHRDSVLVLPAHLLAWLRWRHAQPPGARAGARPGTRPTAGPAARSPWRTVAGATFLAGCLALLAYEWMPQLREDVGFLLGGGASGHGRGAYGLLSGVHLANVANELFLLGPLGFLTLLALTALPRGPRADAPTSCKWLAPLAAAVPYWLLLLLVRSNQHGLGAIRDWDAYSPAGLFTAVLAARALAALVEARPRLQPLAWAVVLAGALDVAAWLGVNASEERALARAETIAHAAPELPVDPATLAFETLAYIHQMRGEFDVAARDYASAADLAPNPRYIWAEALNLYAAGRLPEAEAQFRRGAAQNPGFRRKLTVTNERSLRLAPNEPLLLMMHRALAAAESAAVERDAK